MKPRLHGNDDGPLVVMLSRISATPVILEAAALGVTTDKLIHDLVAEALLARARAGTLLSDRP